MSQDPKHFPVVFFGFKSDTAVLTFTFRFLFSPLFSLFLPHFFFSCWAFSRLCFGGRVFRKAFRILGLGERKLKVGEQWNKIFMEIFRSMTHGFLLLSPVSLTELSSFWYGLKDLFTPHKLADMLSLTVKTDDVIKGRKDVDPHGRLQAVQGRMG